MKNAALIIATVLVATTSASIAQPRNRRQIHPASSTTSDPCRTEQFIVVFAKYFDIDSNSQKPIGDTGRAVVLRKGQTLKGWKLDQDRWRWHCGTGGNQWAGPVGTTIGNVAQIPGVGSLFTGIFGNWEAARLSRAKSIDIEYRADGRIIWSKNQ